MLMAEKTRKRGIKLEGSNIFTDRNGVEHYPIFASEFLFPDSVEHL